MAEKEENKENLSKAGFYARISNFMFYKISNKLLEKGHFKDLKKELLISGIPIFSTSYVSIMFFSTLVMFVFGFIISVVVASIRASMLAFFQYFGLFTGLSFGLFVFLYFYPTLEKMSLKGKIDDELPFVAVHMSAIAGSGIAPDKIFEILISDKESPNTSKEFKKVVNQVNVYGYDIVTALKNVSKETASKKLSELLNGMAVTISEGGELADFLKKRAESLFFDYKLSRERYTKIAETFMNIYISIVITAPMIFSLLIILMGVSGFGLGISTQIITLGMILGVALVNIVFLVALHLKQPSY